MSDDEGWIAAGTPPPTSEEIADALLGAQSVVYAVADAELRFVQVAPTLPRLLGRRPASLVGETLESVIGESWPDVREAFEAALADGTPRYGVRIRHPSAPREIDVLPVWRDARPAGVVVVGHVLASEPAEELAARFAFEQLLIGISTRFIEIELDAIDGAISSALADVGTAKGLDRIVIYERHRSGVGARCTHDWQRAGLVAPPIPPTVEAADFAWGRGIATAEGRVVIPRLDGLPEDARAEREAMQQRGTRSIVVIPLVVGAQPLGAITFETTRRERSWDEATLVRLDLVAGILAGALERRRLGVETRELRRLERLVTEVAAHFVEASSAKLDAAFALALATTAEAAGADRALFYAWSADGASAELRHTWLRERDAAPPPLMPSLHLAALPWLVARVRDGAVTVIDDLRDPPPEAAAEVAPLAAIGVRSSLVLPLRCGGEILGFVSLSTVHHTRHWSPELIAGLGVLADVIAGALVRERAEHARQEVSEALVALTSDLGADGPDASLLALARKVRQERSAHELEPAPPHGLVRTDAEVRALERANLIAALEATGNRVAGAGGAAELLGMSPSTLRDRLRSFGIETGASSRGTGRRARS